MLKWMIMLTLEGLIALIILYLTAFWLGFQFLIIYLLIYFSSYFHLKKTIYGAQKYNLKQSGSLTPWNDISPAKRKFLKQTKNCVIITIQKESTHSKVDAYRMTYLPLSERRPFRLPTGWALFFRLFLLSRKVSNAMINPLEDISRANIPRKTIMIS